MTKLILYVLDYKEDLLFSIIKLKFAGEEIKVTSDRVEIQIKYKHKYYSDYYTEVVTLYNSEDNKIMKEYKLELYFRQTNSYSILLNSKNHFSFDLLIYSEDSDLLPKEIKYEYNNKINSIKIYDSFGIKRVRKFGFINCEKDWIIKCNPDIHFPSFVIQGSYYINIYFKKSNKYSKIINQTSIYKIHLYDDDYNIIDFNLIDEKTKEFFIELPNNILECYEKIKSENSDINEKNTNFMIHMMKIKEKIDENNYDKLSILKDLLPKRINLYLNEREYNICFGYILYIFIYSLCSINYSFIIYGKLLEHINKINAKIKNNLEKLRFILWYTEYILLTKENRNKLISNIYKSVESGKKNISDFNDIEPFKVLLIQDCKENTPYNLAVNFLNKFIRELSEDSFIFEILFLIDSEVSINRTFKNCRMFKLSMISLEQIKQHLFLLIPNIIIRYDRSEQDQNNGSFLRDIGLIRIYEGTLFKMSKDEVDLNIINKEDKEVRFTIPIVMLLFHDCFCHSKIRKRFDSPSYFYNPYDDLTLVFHCDNGECGRLFEFYISPNIDVIKFLKYSYVSMPELLETKYWTCSNREELWDYINKKMKKNKIEITDQLQYFPTNLIKANLDFAERESDYEILTTFLDNTENDSKIRRKYKKKKKIIDCK